MNFDASLDKTASSLFIFSLFCLWSILEDGLFKKLIYLVNLPANQLKCTYDRNDPWNQLFRNQNKYFALRILSRSRNNFVLIYFFVIRIRIVCLICPTKDDSLHLKFVLVLVSWKILIISALITNLHTSYIVQTFPQKRKEVYLQAITLSLVVRDRSIQEGGLFH